MIKWIKYLRRQWAFSKYVTAREKLLDDYRARYGTLMENGKVHEYQREAVKLYREMVSKYD